MHWRDEAPVESMKSDDMPSPLVDALDMMGSSGVSVLVDGDGDGDGSVGSIEWN